MAEGYDPFSAPDVPVGKFDIITCIEAIEHVPEPMQTFRTMTEHLADDGMIIVGETLQPDDIERIRCSWWYVAPRNGHCSTFDRRTMATIADQLGLLFRSQAAGGPHVLHRPEPGALRGIAERLGPAVTYFRLGAPGIAGDRWNGVERPEGRPAFQWSAATELAWDVTVPPGPKRRVTRRCSVCPRDRRFPRWLQTSDCRLARVNQCSRSHDCRRIGRCGTWPRACDARNTSADTLPWSRQSHDRNCVARVYGVTPSTTADVVGWLRRDAHPGIVPHRSRFECGCLRYFRLLDKQSPTPAAKLIIGGTAQKLRPHENAVLVADPAFEIAGGAPVRSQVPQASAGHRRLQVDMPTINRLVDCETVQ